MQAKIINIKVSDIVSVYVDINGKTEKFVFKSIKNKKQIIEKIKKHLAFIKKISLLKNNLLHKKYGSNIRRK